MIVVYPMLVSQAVENYVLPGIAKALESYMIVYGMDDVLASPEVEMLRRNVSYKIRGGKIFGFVKEGLNLSEEEQMEFPFGPGTKTTEDDKLRLRQVLRRIGELETENKKLKEELEKAKRGQSSEAERKLERELKKNEVELKKRKDERDAFQQNYEREKEKREEELKKTAKRTAKISSAPDLRTLALEPTYTMVTYKKGDQETTEMLGIKVVPMRVISDSKLSHLILFDHQMNAIMAQGIIAGRKIMRAGYRFIDRWTGGTRTMTGDPRKDVVMGRSGHKGETFVVIDKGQDIDATFFSQPGRINRLFKMGWSNIVITDSVNREAYFCMKKFRGMCNILHYAQMFERLGQTSTYQSITDAKKQNASLFKVGKKFTKVLGESKILDRQISYTNIQEAKKMDTLNTYLETLHIEENEVILQELEIKKYIEKFLPISKARQIISKLVSISKEAPEKIITSLEKVPLPKVSFSVVDKVMKSSSKEYKGNKDFAAKVLENSLPKASKQMIEVAATTCVLRSMFKLKTDKGEQRDILRKVIIDVVNRTKKFQDDYMTQPDEEQKKKPIPSEAIPDYALGLALFMVIVAGVSALMYGGITLVLYFAGTFPVIGVILLFLIILYTIFTYMTRGTY